ncbi:MAG: right-handed parallel beta-helix repeat-containing protein [Pirellulaceae bacterium]
MNRPWFWIAAVGFGLAAVTWMSPRGSAQPDVQRGLPGARAVIDAAEFPSLQAALDAVPDEGALVRLPAGTFEIHEPLWLRTEDTTLEGCGTATHIKNMNTDGKPALRIAHRDMPGDAKSGNKNLWRIRLANFRITGNEQSGHGIEAVRINEIFLDGVTVSYHGGAGILLDNCYEDPRVCDCLITYNKSTGLDLQGCHDIVVSSNQFEENQDALHCFDGYNLCMTGNCVDDHLGRGVVIENTYGSVVSGNMIEECHDAAIVLDRDCYGITLSANVIAHNGAGIDLRDAHGCAVSANTLTILKTDALRIGPASGRIAVSGNSFSNSFIGDDKIRRAANDAAAAGMVLAGASDVGVSGNVFSSVAPKAVALEGEANRRILFADNVITDSASDHGQLQNSHVADNLESVGEPAADASR